MIRVLRKNARSVVGFILIAVMAIVMTGFGVDFFTGRGGKSGADAAITVDGTEVSFNDYHRTYEMYLRFVKDSAFAKQQALDGLIRDTLIRKFTEALGLTAGIEQIQQKILGSPFFDGSYDGEKLKRYLRQIGMTSTELRSATREEITRGQLQTMFSDLGMLSEPELKAIYGEENLKAKFRFVKIDVDAFRSKVDTNDSSKLEAFFREHQERYRRPRSVHYAFTQFKSEDFRPKVQIHEEDLKGFYEDRADEFVEPAQLHLKKIFFKVEEKKSEDLPFMPSEKPEERAMSEAGAKEKALTKTKDIVKRVRDGEKLPAIIDGAKTQGEAPEVQDMGWLAAQAVTPPALRSAAEKLALGEISEPVATPEGLYLLYAEDAKPERQKSFEEVKAIVDAELRDIEAPAYAQAAAEDALKTWVETKKPGDLSQHVSLAEYAQAHAISVEDTGRALEASDSPSSAPGLTQRVIEMTPGTTEIVELPNSYVVVEVREVKESYIPEFAAVREAVLKDFIESDSKRIAKELADTVLAKGKDGSGAKLARLAEDYKLEVKETALTSSNDATGEFFNTTDVRDAVYGLLPDQPLYNQAVEVGNSLYLVELAERQTADLTAFEKSREEIVEHESEEIADRMFGALLARLKDRATIVTNPSLTEENS